MKEKKILMICFCILSFVIIYGAFHKIEKTEIVWNNILDDKEPVEDDSVDIIEIIEDTDDDETNDNNNEEHEEDIIKDEKDEINADDKEENIKEEGNKDKEENNDEEGNKDKEENNDEQEENLGSESDHKNIKNDEYKTFKSIIKVNDSEREITKGTKLNIFKNILFNNKEIIAPGSKGTYMFNIKNLSGKNIKYEIIFNEISTYKINMKYKLKINGKYVKGNENEYVSVDELSTYNLGALKGTYDECVLEWCWVDDDENDAYAGLSKIDQYYSLNLKINAQEY